ncbi:uncharacterized protein LOC124947643 isoform X3 [Vespa velutina]|uniref:uncharacterized protein LOC124947643 isoform X3 n=1 Tax=Vespa velutina TaxID=202808 RepID=UPI001FB40EE1|nr:uncharacterized protein LOC124947643 isoform X3 [Vespa velutina]XP_047346044.1 uncharacterized protein LOC124947643 isoform X3 [Vespa velutina]XP_047346046.1 uncharacterized protein LOC124947643 isoform X3 [Vespa velutina]
MLTRLKLRANAQKCNLDLFYHRKYSDYVSDVTSKFLPAGRSPWQINVINCFFRGEEYQICLIRVHHLLLRLEHLSLADFLPLKYSTENWACEESDSPFTNLYVEPSALPRLHQKLTENFSNYWNEFLCNNDPIERPEIMKKRIGVFQCVKIAVIVLVATSKELTRQYRKSEGLRFFDFFIILQREVNKRNFGVFIIFYAVLRTLHPIDTIYAILAWSWYLLIILTLKTPILIFREFQALQSKYKHFYPDTLISMIWCYLPLIIQATIEVFSIMWIAIGAPKLILEELFLKHPQANRLQTISPCGRKVVAWSEEVSLDVLKKISSVTGATDAEILLTAIVDSLKEYFRHSGVRIPDDVLTTAKFVNQKAIFLHNHETRGIVCLALPTRTPLFEDDLLEILQVIQRNVQETRAKQSAIYAITATETSRGLISSIFPSILLKLILNQLSRRYSLSLTHVDGDLQLEGVDAAVYWRPPQGNCSKLFLFISLFFYMTFSMIFFENYHKYNPINSFFFVDMSITLHRYGNGVRLGVMGDALIGPQHSIITRTFPKSLQNLSAIVGVPKTPVLEHQSRSPSPHSASPTTSPGY